MKRIGLRGCAIATLLVVAGCGVEPGSVDDPLPPTGSPASPLIGFLIEEGVHDSELVAPLEISHQVRDHAPPGFRVCTLARTKSPIRTSGGLTITPDFDYATAPPLDVIVLPGAERHVAPDFADAALTGFAKERAASAKFVLSLGGGAFVLGAAGCLDEKTCTTFPGEIERLRARQLNAQVVDNVSFVVDGNLITSVGGVRSYDAALYLIERWFGAGPARGVARGQALDWDLRAIPHLIVERAATRVAAPAYRFGERIDPETFVEDAVGARHRLLDLPGDDDRVVVVVIFGGAALVDAPPRAGLWCEDSLNEIGTYRHAIARFDERGAAFVAVACPPLHHEARFGFEVGAFRPGGSSAAREEFAAATEALVRNGLLPFPTLYFDFEYRWLRDVAVDPPQPGDAAFVGRFRADDEFQEYGTPSVWILSRDGVVLSRPFHGNNWEKDTALRHTPREFEAAIARALEITEAPAPLEPEEVEDPK